MDPANKSDQNQAPTGVSPVDTSYGDGATNPIPTIPSSQPVVEEVPATTAVPVTSSLPASASMDATAGNQPTVAVVPPPPSNGQTVTSFKPTRGKFTSTGIIATIFGILVLVAATVVGITQVGQVQIFREKASGGFPECTDYYGKTCNGEADSRNCTAYKDGSACDSSVTCKENTDSTFSYNSTHNGIIDSTCEPPLGGDVGAACQTHGDCKVGLACVGNCQEVNCVVCNPNTRTYESLGIPADHCKATNNQPGDPCGGGYGDYCSGSCCDASNAPADCVAALYQCPGQSSTLPCTQLAQSAGQGSVCLVSNYCGSQQADVRCADGSVISTVTSLPDAGSCNPDSPTNPPQPHQTCGDNGGNCFAPDEPIEDSDPNNSPVFKNCGDVGREPSGGECPGNQVCCRLPGQSNPEPKCESIFVSDGSKNQNGAFQSKTAAWLARRKPGDIIILVIKGGGNDSPSTDFDKARFAINGGPRNETTKYITVERDYGSWIDYRRYFYLRYKIPQGVTDFRIIGDVHHAGKNRWY